MLNFDFSVKGLGLVSFLHILHMIFQEKCFLFYILLTDQVLLYDCLNFLKYWAIWVLQLFISQFVTL